MLALPLLLSAATGLLALLLVACDQSASVTDPELIAFWSTRDGNDEIYLMNADGSGQVNLTKNSAFDGFPAWSPDGTAIAFVSERGGHRQIYVTGVDGSEATRLIDGGRIQYTPAWSPDGRKIAFLMNEASSGDRDVYVVNIDGSGLTNLSRHPGRDGHPSWSPDGQRIVFMSDRDGNPEIYVVGIDGLNLSRLTFNDISDNRPTWSPGEEKIAFVSVRDGPRNVYVMDADGSNQTNLSNNLQHCALPAAGLGGGAWSRNGQQLVFTCGRTVKLGPDDAVSVEDIFVVKVGGTQKIAIADSLAKERHPSWSPDGTKIVFSYSRTPPLPNPIASEIYLVDADGSSSPVRLTNHVPEGAVYGASAPNWSP